MSFSVIPILFSVVFLSACSSPQTDEVDKLNALSYYNHYRNLDSTTVYARRALALADNYDTGRAEALNNLAFVSIMKMDYEKACKQLDSITSLTDNQVELLIADVQYMRLCQRKSQNKDFYDYHESAIHRMQRIQEERSMLNPHQHQRMVYAISEFNIITSTYYYYVGLEQQSVDAIMEINPDGEIRTDTAQLLAYYYNVGAGGIITEGSTEEIAQQEFDNLMRCYLLSRQYNFPFWKANALQAISEHLQQPAQRAQLIRDNMPAMKFINVDQMPDSLLAGNLAQRSLDLFSSYGDIYQIAGAYRTLAQCYWYIEDYNSALICLENALNKNKAIRQAPDLVASICEQLSLVYSALDDKENSDDNRNIYLDLQDETRQDRFLESRADQLDRTSKQLNLIITIVVMTIIVVLFLLFLFDWLRRRSDKKNNIQSFLAPLQEWQQRNKHEIAALEDHYEEVCEDYHYQTVIRQQNKERNLEQRAKVSLVNSITPLIDRMLHEIHRLTNTIEDETVRKERLAYIGELTEQINDYNDLLTEWIQMRQGQLSLHIESFPLQPLFDIIRRNSTSYTMKELSLEVKNTDAVVKADRILTLFMISTLADNARKFTPAGGSVTVSASQHSQYVEIAVEDTGIGMTEEERLHLFEYKPIHDSTSKDNASHGFGLMNCKGIIEKYKKVSQLFSVCSIDVSSEKGKGSTFTFRLPKGVSKMAKGLIMLFGMTILSLLPDKALAESGIPYEQVQTMWADSVFHCNVEGRYQQAISYADSCLAACNAAYHKLYPDGDMYLSLDAVSTEPMAEVKWFQQGLKANYTVLLSVRNEVAVAALALHKWSLYYYNNKVYTHLFNEMSADRTLGDYCRAMQRSETNKSVAVVILILLLASLLPAYYFIYYRHRLHEQYCIRRLEFINEQLLSNMSAEEKLQQIRKIDYGHFPEKLKDIVNQIIAVLKDSVTISQARQTDIELMSDECRRVQMENERYYVANSVLDNCLSTLKHETMYYPSRIRHIIDNTPEDLLSVANLAEYYKELYSILSHQTMRQIEAMKPACRPVNASAITGYESDVVFLGDENMLSYLFVILKQQNKNIQPEINITPKDTNYALVTVHMKELSLTEEECMQLFSPSAHNLPFFLCRQIVRDTGESTNLRGCGIIARKAAVGTDIEIMLGVKKMKN